MIRFTTPITPVVNINNDFPTNKQTKIKPKLVKMLTEYSYSSNGILIFFYKMKLESKKGSGLCYLKADLNRMN